MVVENKNVITPYIELATFTDDVEILIHNLRHPNLLGFYLKNSKLNYKYQKDTTGNYKLISEVSVEVGLPNLHDDPVVMNKFMIIILTSTGNLRINIGGVVSRTVRFTNEHQAMNGLNNLIIDVLEEYYD